VLEDEDRLGGGLIVGAGADLDDGALFEVRELDLESQGVVGGTGGVLKLELVGVVIKLEDLENLGDNIEVLRRLLGLGKLGQLSGGLAINDVVGREELVGPLLQGLDDGLVLGLLSGLLARVSVRCVVDNLAEGSNLLGRVEDPRAVHVHVQVELALALPESEHGTVDADDITNAVNNGEVLEALGVDDDGGVRLAAGLGVESRVNDLEGADEVLFTLVREGSINDDTIEVAGIGGGEGSLGELDVLVLGRGRLGLDDTSRGSGGRSAGHFERCLFKKIII